MKMTPQLVSFIVACLLVADSSATRWLRRDLHARDVFVPQRVDIPLKYDDNGRYVAAASMGTQNFNFSFTTGTGLSYVAGVGCQGCGGVNMYNLSASSSAQTIGPATVPFFNSTVQTSIIKENCTMHLSNGSTWPYPNQTFFLFNQESTNSVQRASDAVVGSDIPGFLGFGTNRGTPSNASGQYQPVFEDSIFGQWLSVHPTALNFTFGMALEPPIAKLRNVSSPDDKLSVPETNDAGTLHWLQADTSFYNPDEVSWATVDFSLAGSGHSGIDPQDWLVSLDGSVAITRETTITNYGKVTASIDPLYQGIYIPLDQATALHTAIPGSERLPVTSTLGSLAQSWSIPCDTKYTFGIIVGSQTFTLDSSVLVITQPDGTCVSGIEAWTDSDLDLYLLGARLISWVYLIFMVRVDGTNSIGFASRMAPSSSESHVGVIVGGTIGGLALVLISVFALWWFCIRPQPSSLISQPSDEPKRPDTYGIVPYTLVAPQSPSGSPNLASQSSFRPESNYTGTQDVFPSDRSEYTTNPFTTPQPSPNTPSTFAQRQEQVSDDRPPPAYDEAAESARVGREREGRQVRKGSSGSRA